MPVRSKFLHELINRTPVKRMLLSSSIFVSAYFNILYLQKKDPYRISKELNKAADTNKYDQAFGLLNGFHGRNALEIACGEGRLTHYVTAYADKVLAFDISSVAIRRARQTNPDPEHISYEQGDLSTWSIPDQGYDLVFCSEVLSYISRENLDEIVARVAAWVGPSGELLLIHHRSQKDDTAGLALKEFGAKTIHDLFLQLPDFSLESDQTEPWYRITLLQRNAQ
jgi:2-polyprenyl-3-methyl-5-hydroxy-6-metoxy-1,4-benzoquinol methylase